MGIRAWLKEERVILFSVGGDGRDDVVVHDGVPRWKRLLRAPGKWLWRERDWLIKAVVAAAIAGVGALIGKYWLK